MNPKPPIKGSDPFRFAAGPEAATEAALRAAGSDPFRFAPGPEAAAEAAPRAAGSDPFRLVAGIGCSLGCPPEELRALIEATLPKGELVALATVDRRAHEPAMLAAAAHFGVPLRTYAAEQLAAVDVPTPSDVVARHVGTPSVAEAAALLSGALWARPAAPARAHFGLEIAARISGTRLLVPKTRSEHATCAVAECPE